MKMKTSLNSAALKQFFITHGEKVGSAVAVVGTLLLVYSAFQVEPYTKTPKLLEDDVRFARANVAASDKRLDLEAAEIRLPSKGQGFSEKIDRELLSPLDPANFAGIEWNKPLFDTKQRRREPSYLALRDLRVAFHYDAVSFKAGDNPGAAGPAGPAAKGQPLGEEWISVTGLVPLEEQKALYTKAFHNALDTVTNADPTYRIYQIRRAEVKSLDPNEAVEWDKIQPLNLQTAVNEVVSKWAAFGPETAVADAVRLPLTEPLPPLPSNDYGSWTGHPEIPRPVVQSAPVEVAPTPTAEQPAFDILTGSTKPPAARPAPTAQQPNNKQPVEEAPKTKYLLFRFLDFNVEPGKYYRYQVKLVLANPNYQLDAAHLEKPSLAAGETRETTWSAPSQAIGVPFLDRYFVGGVKTLGNDGEPSVVVAERLWVPKLAAMGLVEFLEYMRGALLVNSAATIHYAIPGGGGAGKVTEPFNSGAMLVDFAWERTAEKQRGPGDRAIARPSEALVLNSRGQLVVCAQTMDSGFWEDLRVLKSGAAPVAPAQPGGLQLAAPAAAVGAAPAAVPNAAAPNALQPPANTTPAPAAGSDVKAILRLK
jgi:hypothetical protein